MNDLQIFSNSEFGNIRTVTIDGEPWFVGKDIAEALGYGKGKSLNNAVATHVDEEDKGVTEMMTPGGKQNLIIINESGLYSLILSSKLPNAKKFKHWVTSEVLPALRKNGTYSMGQQEEQNVSDEAEITTDQFIRISEIVGNCPKSNTPYVLNILRHIIPDIDAIVDEEPVEQTTEVSVNIKQKQACCRNGVQIDIDKLKMTMKFKHISEEAIAEKMNVSVRSVYNWISGKTKPVIENRIKLCMALGEDENYLTPKRKRNVRKD